MESQVTMGKNSLSLFTDVGLAKGEPVRAIRTAATPAAGLLRNFLVLALAVAGVVIGILAMHTLNLMADSSSPLTTATVAAAHHTETTTPNTAAPHCDNNCGPVDHEMSSMTLCVLALLAGVLFVAAGVASWRQEQRWGPVLARLLDPLRAAVPAPPSLHVLSISRT